MQNGHTVAIETNGTGVIPPIDSLWVTCSPKAPYYRVCPHDEIKLVVSEDLTFEMAKAIAIAASENKFVWLQPCDGPFLEESKKRIIKLVKQYPDKFRAGIQLHKWYEVV